MFLVFLFFHSQRNPFFCQIHADDFHFHDIADFHHLQGMLDIAVAHLGNVNQPVLMNADVHEGAARVKRQKPDLSLLSAD